MARTEKEIAILDATLALIAERGFHNTPVSQIAKRSGVSAGIIYHYFDNKEALIYELYRDIKKRYMNGLLPQAADLGWAEIFEQMWLNAFDFLVAHPQETLFLEQFENSPFAHHTYEADELAASDDTMTRVMQLMQAQMEAGVVQAMPTVALYELTFGVVVRLAKRQINGTVQLDRDMLRIVANACRRAIETE